MEVKDQAGGAPTVESSATTENLKKQESTVSEAKADNQIKAVPYDDYKRMADDMVRFKNRVRELEEREKLVEEKRLKESGEWKTLAEEYEQKYKKLNEAHVQTKRFDAVKQEAIKLGLRNEAEDDLEMIDFNDVDIELTNTGRFIVKNADLKAQQLKKSKPHWFQDLTAPRINTSGGIPKIVEENKLSKEDFQKIEEMRWSGKISNQEYANFVRKYIDQKQNLKQ